jgi:hypothetical protein
VTFGVGPILARANSFDSSYSSLTEVLKRHVRNDGNAVDYAGLPIFLRVRSQNSTIDRTAV